MDTVLNLKAFLATAETGSFTMAARREGVAPSVITKRINQLEHRVKMKLFERSTRKVKLTDTGLRCLSQVRRVINDLDETIATISRPSTDIEGSLRVKAPTTLTVLYLAKILALFQQSYPRISLEVILVDHAINPAEEGFDVAIGAMPTSYGDVVDIPLRPLQNMVCASPEYLRRTGMPTHPRDLVDHDCLSFIPSGANWFFRSGGQTISIDVHPKLASNDRQVLLAGAIMGNGIALLADYIAMPSIREGTLVQVLDEFPIPEHWLKILVPKSRMEVARVAALVSWLDHHIGVNAPWEAS
jgi:DNA-binding transcriptional LysR family regulator